MNQLENTLDDEELKKLDDIIGSHLPDGYRQRLIDLIQEIATEAYDSGYMQG